MWHLKQRIQKCRITKIVETVMRTQRRRCCRAVTALEWAWNYWMVVGNRCLVTRHCPKRQIVKVLGRGNENVGIIPSLSMRHEASGDCRNVWAAQVYRFWKEYCRTKKMQDIKTISRVTQTEVMLNFIKTKSKEWRWQIGKEYLLFIIMSLNIFTAAFIEQRPKIKGYKVSQSACELWSGSLL